MLAREANSFSTQPVLLTNLVERDGTVVNQPAHIYMTLTHLEEERLENKQAIYQHNRIGGQFQVFQPPIRLNAYVLFSAVNRSYPSALNTLSLISIFFQHYNVFKSNQYPNLNNRTDSIDRPWSRVEELTAQLFTITYEQQSYMWSCLGAKYSPSLLYKFRLLVVFDQETEHEASPILEGANSETAI